MSQRLSMEENALFQVLRCLVCKAMEGLWEVMLLAGSLWMRTVVHL
jgi:hypothetical protein